MILVTVYSAPQVVWVMGFPLLIGQPFLGKLKKEPGTVYVLIGDGEEDKRYYMGVSVDCKSPEVG